MSTWMSIYGYPSVTLTTLVHRVCVCMDTCSRFGVLENDVRPSEVFPGQADQVLSEQRFSSALCLPLTAVQEGHHPLEGVFHVALDAGLIIERH